jgi:hypothetical protein
MFNCVCSYIAHFDLRFYPTTVKGTEKMLKTCHSKIMKAIDDESKTMIHKRKANDVIRCQPVV